MAALGAIAAILQGQPTNQRVRVGPKRESKSKVNSQESAAVSSTSLLEVTPSGGRKKAPPPERTDTNLLQDSTKSGGAQAYGTKSRGTAVRAPGAAPRLRHSHRCAPEPAAPAPPPRSPAPQIQIHVDDDKMATGVLRVDKVLSDDSSLSERKRRPWGSKGMSGHHRFIILPFSTERILWDRFIGVVIIYMAISLPVTPRPPEQSARACPVQRSHRGLRPPQLMLTFDGFLEDMPKGVDDLEIVRARPSELRALRARAAALRSLRRARVRAPHR
jgi:hypothetical protein